MNQCPKFKFGSDDTIYRHDGGTAIPSDEPVFLIRGKDEAGVAAIREYIRVMAEYAPFSELAREHAESATAQLDRILAFQEANPERVGMGCHTCSGAKIKQRFRDINKG